MDLLWSNPNAALRSQGTVKWARAAERSFSSEACHLRDELVGGQSWILHVPGGSSGWLLNFTAKRGVCPMPVGPRGPQGLPVRVAPRLTLVMNVSAPEGPEGATHPHSAGRRGGGRGDPCTED